MLSASEGIGSSPPLPRHISGCSWVVIALEARAGRRLFLARKALFRMAARIPQRFPYSERQGIRWWEVDLTHYILAFLSWTGIVRDIKG